MHVSSSHSKYDLSREKRAARKLFRGHDVFNISKDVKISYLPNIQHENGPFNSILRCQLLAESNRRMFYEGVVTTGTANVNSYISLFKSDNEEEEVNTFSITKLREATKTIAKYLPKDMQKDVNLALKSSDVEKLKQTYWHVYHLFQDDDD